MRRNTHLIIIFFSVFLSGQVAARVPIDSLIRQLDTLTGDPKAKTLVDISQRYWYNDPDSAVLFAERALTIARQLDSAKREGFALNAIGYAYYLKGFYVKALDYLFQGKRAFERTAFLPGIGAVSSNIGSVYLAQKSYRLAIQNFDRYRQIAQEMNSPTREAAASMNLGVAYSRLEQYDSARFFYAINLKINRQLNDSLQLGIVMGNIGDVFLGEEELDSAYRYYQPALAISEKITDYEGIILMTAGIADVLLRKGNVSEALAYAERSHKLAKKYRFRNHESRAAGLLADIHEADGHFERAYRMHVRHKNLHDSIFNEKNTRELTRLESAFQLQKQQQEIESLQKDREIQQLNNRNLSVGVGLLTLLLGVGGFSYFRDRKKSRLLRLKNTELNQQQEEILTQRDAIEEQNTALTQRNRQVMASISYAERIQRTLLPSEAKLQACLPNSFLFYRPRDVVSGDFYWLHEQNGWLTFALLDCTGHGVPGAMMSMMGIQMLNELRVMQHIPPPDVILEHLDNGLRTSFGEGDRKDGMDGMICQLNPERGLLSFAGTHATLFLVDEEVVQHQGDRRSLGTGKKVSFQLQQLPVVAGTMLYLASDGLVDQFGGAKNRKLLRKRLRSWLQEIAPLPVEEQKSSIAQRFDAWQGKNRQIDDVTLWGIRL